MFLSLANNSISAKLERQNIPSLVSFLELKTNYPTAQRLLVPDQSTSIYQSPDAWSLEKVQGSVDSYISDHSECLHMGMTVSPDTSDEEDIRARVYDHDGIISYLLQRPRVEGETMNYLRVH